MELRTSGTSMSHDQDSDPGGGENSSASLSMKPCMDVLFYFNRFLTKKHSLRHGETLGFPETDPKDTAHWNLPK